MQPDAVSGWAAAERPFPLHVISAPLISFAGSLEKGPRNHSGGQSTVEWLTGLSIELPEDEADLFAQAPPAALERAIADTQDVR
jgi:hypothetical protein